MRRLIILGILLCVLSGSRKETPAGLLARDQMVSILVDLELARAMAWHYTDDENTACWLFRENALLVYQAHDTDLDIFQRSYQYYLTRLSTMQSLYELVIKRIEALAEQL